MKIKRKKLIAGFVLSALLVVASGFCYGLVAQASMGDMHAAHASADTSNCHGEHKIAVNKATPLHNAVAPCCVDRHDNTPAAQILSTTGIAKIVALENQAASSNVISFFENKLTSSSDTSPPKPDKLSSVLRLE